MPLYEIEGEKEGRKRKRKSGSRFGRKRKRGRGGEGERGFKKERLLEDFEERMESFLFFSFFLGEEKRTRSLSCV